ncbi:MAG: hypothetical protein K2G80_05575 [Bacteroidales bacterium]|nr:hypothetical protein [Bacteroidales bacterium]
MISFSEDGKNYTELLSLDNPYDVYKYLYRTYGWKGAERKVRYVRLQASPALEGGSVFCDEVEIW